MKRILFLANHFITLYSFRKELIKQLLEDGHEVIISLPPDSENSYFSDLGCKILITPIDRRGVNPIKDIKLIRAYKKIIKDNNPDIIFSYTIKPNIYGCLAHRNKYKQVCNITGTGATFLRKSVVSRICIELYRLSVKHSYKVFFQNSGDRDFFIRNRMIGDNYELLPGSGCNIEEHPYVPMNDEGVIRFLFIGRVMKLKGIDEYLEAASVIREKYQNTEFYIAGWNEEDVYKRIISEYEEKKVIHYLGFRKDISNWMAKCDCTILPSHGGEGIPNVLLESASTGRACIGTDIYGIRDVIEDSVTGYLFDNGNAKDLAEKIETFIKLSFEEKEAMGKAGRAKVERDFDRRIVIQKYLDEVNTIE